MTPEWEELRNWAIHNMERRTLDKMKEIERRTLPERVAKLLEGFDHKKWSQRPDMETGYFSEGIADKVIAALRTGDTSELEKWQKKT